MPTIIASSTIIASLAIGGGGAVIALIVRLVRGDGRRRGAAIGAGE
jgi:hypothetical protein